MVDILLLQTVSIVVASTGLLIAAIYYALQLRHQTRARQDMVKTRQAEILMKLHSAFTTKEMCEAALKYMSTEYKDYDDFVEKYGSPFAEGEIPTVFLMIGMFFEGIGILLKNRLVPIDLVTDLFAVDMMWLKVKPVAEGLRKQYNNPKLWEWFEYLYDEVKKHEQQLQQ
jgi:hypothetical protein